MQWKRRTPLWPLFFGLGCLLVLAAGIPHFWKHAQGVKHLKLDPPKTSNQHVGELLLIPPVAMERVDIEVDIEPVNAVVGEAQSDEAEWVVTEPIHDPVNDDDWQVVEQPRPPLEEQPLPVRKEFNLEVLHTMRAAVERIVRQLPSPAEVLEAGTPLSPILYPAEPETTNSHASNVPTEDTPKDRAPRVVVESENQRLAMADTRPARPRTYHNAGVLPEEYEEVARIEELTPSVPVSPDEPAEVNEPELTEALVDDLELADTERPEVEGCVSDERETSSDINTEPAKPLIRQRPRTLVEQLHKLSQNPIAASWASSVLSQVKQLTEDGTTTPEAAQSILDQLAKDVEQGLKAAREVEELAVQQNWLQAASSLQRRHGIWRGIVAAKGHQAAQSSGEPSSDVCNVSQCGDLLPPLLSEVRLLLSGQSNGREWQEYLLLDQLASAASDSPTHVSRSRIQLSQEVLSRMTDRRLTPEQREFIASPPLAGLFGALSYWAAGPVDLNALLALQERYEETGKLLFASAIAQGIQRMKWADDQHRRQWARQLEHHYQGANMRVALSADLMNQLVPKQHTVNTPVRERIAGKPVQGRSHTTTDVRVRLIPDSERWRFGLEAIGNVNSQTRSDTWPVWVRNSARFQYEAVKVITIDNQGMAVTPAMAEAKGRNDLTGVASDFDPVPILGSMLRDAARRQHQKSRPQALSQVKAKVAQQAQMRMDSEADPKLRNLEAQFRTSVLSPLEELALAADGVEMFTTDQRAVMQMRLANLNQLAAHTPRPSAPSDSLASLQLHESVLNNAVAGLQLDGRRMTLIELYDFFADKLGHHESIPPEDLPHRAVIEFASHDAVHLGLHGDRLELVLNIRELGQGRDRIQNFRVHAFYRPVVDGLDVRLVRDDTLQFSGRYLRTGPRVVLHSVMGKFFAKGQEVSLLNRALIDDPRLADTMVTQLVIDDGWLAVAIGPEHPQRKPWRTARYELEDEPLRR